MRHPGPATGEQLAAVYRTEHRRVLAALLRTFGDRALADDALGEAWLSAAERWPRDGVPDSPAGWLLTVARNRALDRIRREQQRADREAAAARLAETRRADGRADDDRRDSGVHDDRLRLIFTCCHPALAPEVAIPLTLRTVCGLTTAEIARAFLVPESTMAQRLVRAKRKIEQAGIGWKVPDTSELSRRLDGVLRVVYLIFNEGYGASAGAELVRTGLCDEAIRLAGQLHQRLGDEPELLGVLALMTAHHARREARTDGHGDLVLLADQDRSRWDHERIAWADGVLARALRQGRVGSYQLQAAIALTHATARDWESTNWTELLGLYDLLGRIDPSPVVALNRAVAVAMVHGPQAGLDQLDANPLERSPYWWAARADLARQAERTDEAIMAYARALELTGSGPERRFLERRLHELE